MEKAVNSMKNLVIVIDIIISQPKLLRAVWFHYYEGLEGGKNELFFSSLLLD